MDIIKTIKIRPEHVEFLKRLVDTSTETAEQANKLMSQALEFMNQSVCYQAAYSTFLQEYYPESQDPRARFDPDTWSIVIGEEESEDKRQLH
jgi:hypothetical protein